MNDKSGYHKKIARMTMTYSRYYIIVVFSSLYHHMNSNLIYCMLLKQKTKTQNMSLKFLVMGLYSLNLKISKYIKISFSYIIELKVLFILNNFILKIIYRFSYFNVDRIT